MRVLAGKYWATITAILYGVYLALPSDAAPPTLQQHAVATALYDRDTLNRQYKKLAAMPAVDVTYTRWGTVDTVAGRSGVFLSDSAMRLGKNDSAREIVQRLQEVLLASGEESLTIIKNESGTGVSRTIVATQSIRGIPVLDGGIVLGVERSGEISYLKSRFVPDRGLPRSAKLPAAKAVEIVSEQLVAGRDAEEGTVNVDSQPTLAYWGSRADGDRPALVWVLDVAYMQPDSELIEKEFWVDAIDGTVRGSTSRIRHLSRTTYSANFAMPTVASYPGSLTLLWYEGNPQPQDAIAYDAYQHVGRAHSAWQSFGAGYSPVGIVVHYGNGYDSAFWVERNGIDYVTFGDGQLNSPLGRDLDTVAHEYGHGVMKNLVPFTSGISYNDDRALEEAFGDFSAVIVDVWNRGGTAVADTWRIAQVQISNPATGQRNWINPKLVSNLFVDWYPSKANGLPNTPYLNSTVFGHAYYLLANGGRHARYGQPIAGGGTIPEIVVPQIGHDVAKRIFYAAFNDVSMQAEPDYQRLRSRTVSVAASSFGVPTANAVAAAWAAVGVGHACTSPPPTPSPNIINHYCMGQYDIEWTRVPGHKYHGMVVNSNWPWTLGQTVLDAPVQSCAVQVPGPSRFRMRACNGCGCSAWTHDHTLMFYKPCL